MDHALAAAITIALLGCLANSGQAITIELDYTFDTPRPFFDTPEKRNALEAAANFFSNLLTDHLVAITPEGDNTWSIESTHPNTGAPLTIEDLSIADDTLVVFAGARDLPGNVISESGQWTVSLEGNRDWVYDVIERGQSAGRGRGATDFGPWGSVLSFDTTANNGEARNWYFGVTSPPAEDQFDLFSVALHELGHILGLGRADAWKTLVDTSSNQFTGSESQTEYGGPVDLQPSPSEPFLHWKEGTQSFAVPGSARGDALNAPDLTAGARRLATRLDVAALDDIGWDIAGTRASRRAGDANEDHDFNRTDIIQIMQAGKYRTGQLATWGEGDWNGDGIFDQTDFSTALSAGPYDGSSFVATSPTGTRGSADSVYVASFGGAADSLRMERLARTDTFPALGNHSPSGSRAELLAEDDAGVTSAVLPEPTSDALLRLGLFVCLGIAARRLRWR